MPAYERSRATEFEVIDRWEGGVGWLAHPQEAGERASHAVATDDGLWVIDPVDAEGLDDLLAEYGDVAGVAVLSNYHARDADAVANRHGVPVHVPRWMDRVADRLAADVERTDPVLGAADFETVRVEPLSLYRAVLAYRPDDGTLIVPDLLSSGSGYPTGDERVGMMLGSRLFPPREPFEGMEPERILFGHGRGVFDDAAGALDDALAGARRRLPRALVENLGTNLRLFRAAMLD